MQVERFLAITAVLATGSMMSVGCVAEDDADTNTDAGVTTGGTGGAATGGTGGTATGGTAGTATGGTAGTATGGTAGTATGGTAGTGTGGTAGAGGACFGDTALNDAGAEGIDCTALPYAATNCDPGGEGLSPTGLLMCDYIVAQGRAGVAEAMYACLAAITGDACVAAHDNAVSACVQSVYSNTCEQTASTAPSANCAAIHTECPAIAEADCKINLDPLTQVAGDAVLDCYQTPVGACDADFENCLGLP